MRNQPRYDTLEGSDFFADGRSARQPVRDTVARGQLQIDDHLYKGNVNGELATTFPVPTTQKILARGQERYNIYCSPCHDGVGTGNGIIVQRGFKRPASFHIDRLREASVGYFFDVITNGYGVMYDYSARVAPRDRWAIVAYIRALQLSQHAPVAELPDELASQIRDPADSSESISHDE